MNTKGRVIILTGASLTGMGIAAVEMSERIPPEKAMYLSAKSICSGISSTMTYLESSQISAWSENEYFDIVKDNVDPQEFKYFVLDNIPEIVKEIRWEYRTDTQNGIANKVIEAVNDLVVYVTSEGADIVILTSEDYKQRYSENELEVLEMVNHALANKCDEEYLYVSGGILKII